MLEIKIFTYDLIDSKMYVVCENHCALVIDPCISKEAISYLTEKSINDVKIILTHEHYDHISGIGAFRETFSECEVICSEACNRNIQSATGNGSKYFKALFLDKTDTALNEAERVTPVSYYADTTFYGDFALRWQDHLLALIETPGHSPGSICILLDEKYLFTGDSLLKDISVITRLPGGSKKDYERKTMPFLRCLDQSLYVYPGHGEPGFMKEMLLEMD